MWKEPRVRRKTAYTLWNMYCHCRSLGHINLCMLIEMCYSVWPECCCRLYGWNVDLCYEMTQTVLVIHLENYICRSALWVCLVFLVLINRFIYKSIRKWLEKTYVVTGVEEFKVLINRDQYLKYILLGGVWFKMNVGDKFLDKIHNKSRDS